MSDKKTVKHQASKSLIERLAKKHLDAHIKEIEASNREVQAGLEKQIQELLVEKASISQEAGLLRQQISRMDEDSREKIRVAEERFNIEIQRLEDRLQEARAEVYYASETAATHEQAARDQEHTELKQELASLKQSLIEKDAQLHRLEQNQSDVSTEASTKLIEELRAQIEALEVEGQEQLKVLTLDYERKLSMQDGKHRERLAEQERLHQESLVQHEIMHQEQLEHLEAKQIEELKTQERLYQDQIIVKEEEHRQSVARLESNYNRMLMDKEDVHKAEIARQDEQHKKILIARDEEKRRELKDLDEEKTRAFNALELESKKEITSLEAKNNMLTQEREQIDSELDEVYKLMTLMVDSEYTMSLEEISDQQRELKELRKNAEVNEAVILEQETKIAHMEQSKQKYELLLEQYSMRMDGLQLELNRQLDILSNLSNRYTQSSNHLIRLIHENMSMHDDDVKGLQLQLQKQLELGQMLELNPTALGESVLVDPDSATRLAEEEFQSANIISQMDHFLELLNQMELKQAQRRRVKEEEQKQEEEEEQELG